LRPGAAGEGCGISRADGNKKSACGAVKRVLFFSNSETDQARGDRI
jgi:hypothetical protein